MYSAPWNGNRSCVLASLALLLGSLPAFAQQAPTFSVSVTEPYEIIESLGTVRRIERRDIQDHKALTLDQALRLVPGIYVRTAGDGTPRIDVRGFRSRHVLLLVDGVPYNSAVDGQFDPASMSTESIQEIKISYGSSSVLYGDNAMAAVIEISTVPRDPEGADVHVMLGTPDQRNLGGRAVFTAGRLDAVVAGNVFSTDGYRLPGGFVPTGSENGGLRQNSDRTRQELRVNLGYALSTSTRIGTQWTVGGGAYGIPPTTIDDPADIFAQRIRYARVDDYLSGSGQASVTFVPSGRFNVRVWGFRNTRREDEAQYDDATYSSMEDPLVPGTFQARSRTTVSGGSVLGRVELGRAGWLRMVVNQRRESYDSTGTIRDVAAGGSASGSGGGGGGRGGQTRPAPPTYDVRAFALDRHLDVRSAGAEWQFQPRRHLGAVIGTTANWQDRPAEPSLFEPSWIGGLSYEVTSLLRLHASVTRKIRFPSIDQLYDPSGGNSALQPERALGIDAGVEQRFAGAAVGISVFSTKTSNFIERDPGSIFVNRDRYRFSGTEVTLQTPSIPSVDLRTSYTYLRAVDLAPGTGGAELQYRPRHRGTLDAAWHVGAGVTARGTVEYVADQRYYSRGAAPVQAHAANYALADLSVARVFGRRCELSLGVTNVFDQLYEQSYGLPRAGRAAWLSLEARLD